MIIKGWRRRSGSLSSVVERVCSAPRVPWFDSPGNPAHFVSQAGSLVTRRVLVVDATLKRPKDSLQSMIISGAPSPPAAGVTRVHDLLEAGTQAQLLLSLRNF
jgi:hypothetical protein